MPLPPPPAEPPPIAGVRRSVVSARGVRFHVTEAGPGDGRPVVLLHGWPQHHFAWRHLLADPPAGLRLIAPDLPGYGWSGPPPHRWGKEEVASDVLALLDVLGIERTALVGHDWGGWIGWLLTLRAPQRFGGFLALNIPHPWNTARTFLPHAWRFAAYQPLMAAFGEPLMRRTRFVERVALTKGVTIADAFTPEEAAWFGDSFRNPVCARAARDTYRTFLLRELPRQARRPEGRRGTVPTRCLFGVDDLAIHVSTAAAETADHDDYSLEPVAGCGHFIADERPDLVRAGMMALLAELEGAEPAELSHPRR
jgi:pimeloyl-ACP methyl ester carboxylesterase